MLIPAALGMLLLPGAQAQVDPARAFKEFKKMRVGAVATAKKKK